MENKTNLILAGCVLLGVGYFFWDKKRKDSLKNTSIPSQTSNSGSSSVSNSAAQNSNSQASTVDLLFQDSKPKYPIGNVLSSSQTGLVPTGQKIQLKDGDVVKGVPLTAYILRNGKKHPVTEKWWIYNFGDDYSSIIQLSDANVDVIPTGEVLDI